MGVGVRGTEGRGGEGGLTGGDPLAAVVAAVHHDLGETRHGRARRDLEPNDRPALVRLSHDELFHRHRRLGGIEGAHVVEDLREGAPGAVELVVGHRAAAVRVGRALRLLPLQHQLRVLVQHLVAAASEQGTDLGGERRGHDELERARVVDPGEVRRQAERVALRLQRVGAVDGDAEPAVTRERVALQAVPQRGHDRRAVGDGGRGRGREEERREHRRCWRLRASPPRSSPARAGRGTIPSPIIKIHSTHCIVRQSLACKCRSHH